MKINLFINRTANTNTNRHMYIYAYIYISIFPPHMIHPLRLWGRSRGASTEAFFNFFYINCFINLLRDQSNLGNQGDP